MFVRSRLALIFAVVTFGPLHADEGYWLFDDPPLKAIADKYHATLDEAWLKHLQAAAVKIGGGSGSFVSADGLVITNRHVGAGQLHTLSTRQHNYESDGFYAPTLRDELPCQGFELLVLQRTEDVTVRVNAAIQPGATPAEAEEQHKAIEAAIEKESFDRTGLTSNVITLFGGARYDLYQYKKYPDVRLVFSPDKQAAAYGGDPDNFEFPRFDLDICFFRVYDHDKPLKTSDYLKWNNVGPAADQLIFVAGHPGYSQRLAILEEIDYLRDTKLPRTVADFDRLEKALMVFSNNSEEHARQAADSVASIANGRKAYHGFLNGLREPGIFDAKKSEQENIRSQLSENTAKAYQDIRDVIASDRNNYEAYQSYERFANHSDLFNMARTLVRAANERAKPNGERLPAYRESELASLQFRLFSGRPYHPDLETFFLADALGELAKQMGADDPLVKKVLAGKSPKERAEDLVRGTKLEDIAFRKKIYAGGINAVKQSGDPMLQLAEIMDPAARAARRIDDQNDETKRRAYAVIYQARFDKGLAPKYPDATSTLRLTYGTVTGYEQDGKHVTPLATFAGMFARAAEHDYRAPFNLPKAWADQKSHLNPETPLNFASTADILGGNSGSPVVNAAGEFVGIIFDNNRYGFSGRYIYDPARNRSVAVDSAGIVEALRHVYHADALVSEIESAAR